MDDAQEQELWRLRGVEIDRDEAVARAIEAEANNKNLTALNDTLDKRVKNSEESVRSYKEALVNSESNVEKLTQKKDKLQQTIRRLYKELGNQQYQDHLKETYDFQVADQIPEPGKINRQTGQRRNWRLS